MRGGFGELVGEEGEAVGEGREVEGRGQRAEEVVTQVDTQPSRVVGGQGQVVLALVGEGRESCDAGS